MAQAISNELGQRLSFAHLSGELHQGIQKFMEKCPHLQDLTLHPIESRSGAPYSLAPLAELKAFRSYFLFACFERPLFESFPSVETLEVSMGQLRRHSEKEFLNGIRYVKSLKTDLIVPDGVITAVYNDIDPSGATLSHEFVVEAVATVCHLERLSVMGGAVRSSDRVYEAHAPMLEVVICRSNWPQLKQLDLRSIPISLKELEAICERFSLLRHLSLFIVKKFNMECLFKLKALEEMSLEIWEGSDYDIKELFATGNALFPLDLNGYDGLSAFPRAQKFHLSFNCGEYLLVKTTIGEVQRWLCPTEADGTWLLDNLNQEPQA